MAETGAVSGKGVGGRVAILAILLVLVCGAVPQTSFGRNGAGENIESASFPTTSNLLYKSRDLLFPHVWPEMKFGWKIVFGTIIGFLGAALGSVGGAGGGGIFVPMLILIIGFDPKSSTAISKCMVTGAALGTVFSNLKLRHPSLDLPIIDYDLALLFQPMIVLGISIGVFFNVIFADWMVTVLLILLFIITSTKAFIKGVETWNKETITKKEAARRFASSSSANEKEEPSYKLLDDGPTNETRMRINESKGSKVSIINNIMWKKLSVLVVVWVIILLLHIAKDYTAICSAAYWIVTFLQVGTQKAKLLYVDYSIRCWTTIFPTSFKIPVAFGASGYQAVCLYKGWRVIESTSGPGINWTVYQLILCCFCGVLAGIVGGLLGLGGGFILSPLLLEFGIPPHVSSATATLVMTFSSSMSVIQYYLLKRFPPAYALYFVIVAMMAALVGQCIVCKMVRMLRRASIIIFILASVILISAVSLGYVGILNIIGKVEGSENIWFYNICEYQ